MEAWDSQADSNDFVQVKYFVAGYLQIFLSATHPE